MYDMKGISRCQTLLGTFVQIDIEADADDRLLLSASDAAFNAIHEVQDELSFHDANSALSLVNSSAHLAPVPVSRMFWDLLSWCLCLSKDSDGLFDVSVAPALLNDGRLPNHWPANLRSGNHESIVMNNGTVYFEQAMALDFGGVAKGMAVDFAIQAIKEALSADLVQATVNAGGDIRMYDCHQQVVGVVNRCQNVEMLHMQQVAVASSAAYYDNGVSAIYHPKAMKARKMDHTVSVFASNCQLADALTKVAVLDLNHSVLNDRGAQVVLS